MQLEAHHPQDMLDIRMDRVTHSNIQGQELQTLALAGIWTSLESLELSHWSESDTISDPWLLPCSCPAINGLKVALRASLCADMAANFFGVADDRARTFWYVQENLTKKIFVLAKSYFFQICSLLRDSASKFESDCDVDFVFRLISELQNCRTKAILGLVQGWAFASSVKFKIEFLYLDMIQILRTIHLELWFD